MTIQDLVEKLRRYPLPSSCGGIILVCFFAFYLRTDLLTDLEIENDEVQRQAQQVDQNLSHGQSLNKHIAEMEAKVAEFDARLIKPTELANNLKYFYEIEASTHVSIADLRQPPLGVPAKGAPKTVTTGITYSVLVTGRFDQVVSYLNELEHGRHFFRLENFDMQRGRQEPVGTQPTGPGPVTMALNLQLLGWP